MSNNSENVWLFFYVFLILTYYCHHCRFYYHYSSYYSHDCYYWNFYYHSSRLFQSIPMLCAIRFHHANISLGIVPAQNFSFLPISLGDDFPIEHPEAHWKRGVDRQTHHFWVNFPIDNHINPMISIMTATLSPRCYYQKVAFPMGYTLKVAIDYPHFITFPSFWLSWHFPWINMWASWLRDLSPQRGRHGPELLGVTGRGWCLRCGGLRLSPGIAETKRGTQEPWETCLWDVCEFFTYIIPI